MPDTGTIPRIMSGVIELRGRLYAQINVQLSSGSQHHDFLRAGWHRIEKG
jgi:hypothetical protein